MKFKEYFLLLLIWSGAAHAIDLVVAPASSAAFTVYEDLIEVDPNFSKVVRNMPKIPSQSTLGSCFGCSAAVIAQKYVCDTDKRIIASGVACADLPPQMLISQFSMVAWSDTNRAKRR